MELYMLTPIEQEGAYAVVDEDGEKTLYFFQDEDDAFRYGLLLEADGHPEMEVSEIDPALAIRTCHEYNYNYAIITPDEFVIPPRPSNDSF